MANVFGTYNGWVNRATATAAQWITSTAETRQDWKQYAEECLQAAHGNEAHAAGQLADHLRAAIAEALPDQPEDTLCAALLEAVKQDISYTEIAGFLITGER